ncbi:MAG TPA: SDR family oxidoreductase [Actinomycetales bacterium]
MSRTGTGTSAMTGVGRVAGKVVVVTGAATGLGAAAAEALRDEGALVHAVDLQVPDLPGVVGHRVDVTSPGDWAALVAALQEQHGRCDALVSNAGTTWRARLLDLEPAELHRVVDVNVVGALLGIQALVPLMPAGGSIVTIGSVAALTGHFPVAYTASKWALRGLSKAAAAELGPRGIRVNQVHPGYLETSMTASASPAFRSANIDETPLGRTGVPAEVAPLLVHLVSDESTFTTGAEITVDGGLTSHGGVLSISTAVRS